MTDNPKEQLASKALNRLQVPGTIAGSIRVPKKELEALAQIYKDSLEREKQLRERERYFARLLGVADEGQYRHDWGARLEKVLSDAARVAQLEGALQEVREMLVARENCDIVSGYWRDPWIDRIDDALTPTESPAKREEE